MASFKSTNSYDDSSQGNEYEKLTKLTVFSSTEWLLLLTPGIFLIILNCFDYRLTFITVGAC